MEWKRSVHKQYDSRLLESYSYEHRQGVLLENLQEKLLSAGVVFKPLPESKLLETIRVLGQATSFSLLISEFLKLFKSALLVMTDLYDLASNHGDKVRMLVVVELFEPIYEKYQAYLAERNEIDFEDMIAKSIEYVEEGRFVSPYRYILVDEFQDISASRARLIKALKNQHSINSIFCVGDDWQSIYRFTGSDGALTREFSDHFGVAAINILDLTFRFNQRIGAVAARFIQKNPAQIRKEIKSLRNVEGHTVTLIPDKSDAEGLVRALMEIGKTASQGASVLVLGRYNYIKPDGFTKIKHQHQQLNIDYMTVHGAKGKEADYVVVLGLVNGKNGFLSSRVSNSILSILLPQEEDYQYAEERRLFYVALTRARHHVYLVSHPEKASEFVRELRNEKYPVAELAGELSSNSSWGEEILCPDCQSGYLVLRSNKKDESRFYACNAYPYCEYTQNACPECGEQLIKEQNSYRCTALNCGHISPLCPLCGGMMVLKDGQYGKFWGCSNFRINSCKYTTKHVDIKRLGNADSRYKDYIT